MKFFKERMEGFREYMKGFPEFMKFVLVIWLVCGLLKYCMTVNAAELTGETETKRTVATETVTTETPIGESEVADQTEEEGKSDVSSTEESSTIIEYSFELNQPVEVVPVEPVPVYQLNPDDYNGSLISTFAIDSNVYSGSYNSTIISLWNGLLQNNIGKDYLAYRASQYEYYIFFGEGFEYSGGEFTGSGTYHYYNTYGNQYGYDVGSDSFSVNPGSNYVYTNVSSDFPGLEVERGLLYEQIQIVMLGCVLFIIMFKWIFSGR